MTAATGSMGKAKANLRTTLADSATFRTLVAAANQAQALDDIYLEGLPTPAGGAEVHTLAELQDYRPLAVIFTAEENGYRRMRDSAGSFAAAGRLIIRLIRDAPDDDDTGPDADANVTWDNVIDGIIGDMCDDVLPENDPGGYLVFHNIGIDRGPDWSHPDDAADLGTFQWVELFVEWEGI